MKNTYKWLLGAVLSVAIAARMGIAGGIPVFDAISNFNRMLEHQMTMVKMVLQIEELQSYRQQFAQFDAYRRWIDGEFRQLRAALPNDLTHVVQSGNTDLGLPGFEPPFVGTAASQKLQQAVQSLSGVMNGTGQDGFAQVNLSIRALIGDSPETVIGARTLAAKQEIAAHTAWVNRINAAVDEKRNNIEYLRFRINSGQLTPGDLQREMTILATEQADLQSLQIQAQNAATRVALQQLSLQTGDINGREVERLQDSQDRLSLMQGVSSFSFAASATTP